MVTIEKVQLLARVPVGGFTFTSLSIFVLVILDGLRVQRIFQPLEHLVVLGLHAGGS